MEEWIVSGDFNNVLYSYKRKGGEPVNPRETSPFSDCLLYTGLSKSTGCFFNWNKWGSTTNRIWSMINRILVNLEWLNKMLNCTVNFLPPGVSDHSPMLILWQQQRFKLFPFRFNNKWTKVEGFSELITEE